MIKAHWPAAKIAPLTVPSSWAFSKGVDIPDEKVLSFCKIVGSDTGGFTGMRVALCGEMVDPIFQSDNYVLARKLLDASVVRHQAIASNIANAETPGYHRVDVAPDFAEQLRAQLNSGELAAGSNSLSPHLAEDPNARSVRPDGNSVDIEHELLSMNRNAVEHEYLAEIITQNIKQLKMAITGRSN